MASFLFCHSISPLYNYAKQRSENLLTPRVEGALAAAVEISSPTLLEIKGTVPAERQHQQAARLVVGALTALVLRDKEDLQDLRPGALMDTSQQRYSRYFRWMQSATAVELQGFEVLIGALGEGINYRSLDPRLLSKIRDHSRYRLPKAPVGYALHTTAFGPSNAGNTSNRIYPP